MARTATGSPCTAHVDSTTRDEHPEHPGGAQPDDHRLTPVLAAAQDRDELAFATIYRDLQPHLLRQIRGLVGAADAHDVASEVWLHIFTGINTFCGGYQHFRLWAATIARRRAADHLRRNRPPAPVDPVDVPERAAPENTERDAIEALTTTVVLAAIQDLPRAQAQIVLLRTILGLDAPATAGILGKRPGAIRTGAHRGLRTLAHQLPLGDPHRSNIASPSARRHPAGSGKQQSLGGRDSPRVG